jgi:hypothetical protein
MKTLTVSVLSLALAACAAPEPGPRLPTAERTYPREAEEVWAAALSTAQDIDLTIDAHEHDSSGGRIDARRGGGARVKVLVRSVEPEKSVVAVYADPGHQSLARLFFDGISARLGSGPRPAAP